MTEPLPRQRFQAQARIAEGGERELLYSRLAGRMLGFFAAQMRTPRQIPIIVLKRVAAL